MIEYHPSKANVVAATLSWKSIGKLYYIRVIRMSMMIELRKLNIELSVDAPDYILATLKVRLLLIERIAQA